MTRKNSFLLLLGFIVFVAIFSGVFYSWVKEDFNSDTINDQLKADLAKNPIKSGLAANDNQSVDAANASSQQKIPPPPNQTPPTTDSGEPKEKEADTSSNSPEEKKEEPEKKTFTSEALKVSFDYTDELKIEESGDYLSINKEDISWKLKVYKNDKKEDLSTWFKKHFNEKDNPNCNFTDATIKFGSYESKLVKANSDSEKCESGGNFAISTDKSKVIKADIGKETTDNVNKILSNFKFL